MKNFKNNEERYLDVKRVVSGLIGVSYSPQNSGIANLLIPTSKPTYDNETGELVEDTTIAGTENINGKENVLIAIKRGAISHDCRLMKVTKVDYNIHPAKKAQLNQIGRASEWEWVLLNTTEEAVVIMEANKILLK
jgi:hypothetical protein